MRTLIVYGTCEGQTKKIAEYIRACLRVKGIDAVTFEPGVDAPVEAENFDSFIVGGSVHMSKFPANLYPWIRDHQALLASCPSTFFSVCLGILQKDNPEVIADEHKIVRNFFEATGWKPNTYEIFAGALKYSLYGWLKKRLMRRIARKAGQETDIRRDYEFTDWQQVAHFVGQFVTQKEKAAAPSPTGLPFTSTL